MLPYSEGREGERGFITITFGKIFYNPEIAKTSLINTAEKLDAIQGIGNPTKMC